MNVHKKRITMEEEVFNAYQAGVDMATQALAEMLESEEAFAIHSSCIEVSDIRHFEKDYLNQFSDGYACAISENNLQQGQAVLLFRPGEADKLVAALVKEAEGPVETSEKEDILCEITNITMNSVLKSLSPVVGRALVGDIPHLILESLSEFFSKNLQGQYEALVLHSTFANDSKKLSGQITIYLPMQIVI